MSDPFDYIIVGAGCAGSVLAARLSEDPGTRVLLIEAGPRDSHPFIHMPKGMGKIIDDPALTWRFAAREREGDNRPASVWVRGKTLGGSTAINGMLYIRGERRDHDDMASLTSTDWAWARMSAAYRAIEDHELGVGGGRGVGGPLHVGLPGSTPLMNACIEAGKRMGLARVADLNAAEDTPRIGYSPRTIRGGRRQSAAVAFLPSGRSNLRIETNVIVDAIDFNGVEATGLWTWRGQTRTFYAGRRIVLCAGTLASPAILQRSGVGPPALLGKLGIPVVVDSPDVGDNLQEHLSLRHQWRLRSAWSLNFRLRGWRAALEGARYYCTRRGPLADASFDVAAAFKTSAASPRANAMMVVAPLSIDDSLPGRTPHRYHGFQAGAYLIRPKSTGKVEIESRDVRETPRITMNFFAHPDDRRDMIDVFRFCRKLARQAPLAWHIQSETAPGPSVESDEEIVDAYRTRGGSGFHAAGTCRMGNDDRSVVDPGGRVRGAINLYVMDLSVAPFVLSGATQAPVAALAWRFADLLQADRRDL